MHAYQDLREFLAVLEQHRQLLRISDKVHARARPGRRRLRAGAARPGQPGAAVRQHGRLHRCPGGDERARLLAEPCTGAGPAGGRHAEAAVLRLRRALPEVPRHAGTRDAGAVAGGGDRQGHRPVPADAAVPAEPRRRRLLHRQALRHQPRPRRLGQRRCRKRRRLPAAGEGPQPAGPAGGAAARHRHPPGACRGARRGPADRHLAGQRAGHHADGRDADAVHAAGIQDGRGDAGRALPRGQDGQGPGRALGRGVRARRPHPRPPA